MGFLNYLLVKTKDTRQKKYIYILSPLRDIASLEKPHLAFSFFHTFACKIIIRGES